MSNECAVVDINAVKSCMVVVRNQPVLLAQDVAAIYNVETRVIAQAVKNNPAKFPEGYVFDLTKDEIESLKSKILTSNLSPAEKNAIKMGVRRAPKAFTERGLYMLATVLKGELATKATLAIVNTYAQVRSVKRELLELHKEGDKKKKHALMQHFGETLTDIVMPDPDEVETESSLELNFFIGKIKHTVRKIKKNR